jgi:uncharacterized protein (DUF58 family)
LSGIAARAPRDRVPARLPLRGDAERAAGALPPLVVEADRVAATVIQGVHGRRRTGVGETFWQYRQYEPGDPLRMIDWRQTAKSSRVYIRELEWAAAQTIWVWRDPSASMIYRSDRKVPEKRDRADVLLLALCSLLVHGGGRIALLRGEARPGAGKIALERIALTLLSETDPEPGSALPAIPEYRPLPRHAHLVLFGDFLAPIEEIDASLRRFAARNVRGHLIQVLDPAERALPFTGRTRFEGLESEGHLLIKRVETVRDEYQERLEAHQRALKALTRSLGWTHTVHHTDQPPERTLLTLFVLLTDRQL